MAGMEENEEKKKYLRSYRKAIRMEQDILAEIQRLRARKMFPSIGVPDGMPHSPGGQQDLSGYAAILDAEIGKLKKERLKQARLYRSIEDQIRKMKDDDEQRLLRLKYIKGLTWEKVAEEMHCSTTRVYNIHGRALQNFTVPKKNKKCIEVDSLSVI